MPLKWLASLLGKKPEDKYDRGDPVRDCPLYVDRGCSHVDGFLCDFPHCMMMRQYQLDPDRPPYRLVASCLDWVEARNGLSFEQASHIFEEWRNNWPTVDKVPADEIIMQDAKFGIVKSVIKEDVGI